MFTHPEPNKTKLDYGQNIQMAIQCHVQTCQQLGKMRIVQEIAVLRTAKD